MKIKQICAAALMLLGVLPAAQAQTFDKLWKQVDQAEKKSLPKTVIQLTSEIYRKAETEKDSPQMLKAYTWRMKYRDMLSSDSFYVDLQGLEEWVQKAEKPIDRAVLHSLIAGIYSDYASRNSRHFRQRTDIVDEKPSADMREWSGNMFVQQVIKHTKEALKDPALLLETSSRTYIPFVELGDASDYYHHDMYHLLGTRGVAALNDVKRIIDNDSLINKDISAIFDAMAAAYKTRDNKDAYVLVMLDYLEWRRNADNAFRPYRAPKGLIGLTQDPYLAGLDKLKADFGSLNICAEVYLAKANHAIEKGQQAAALQLCDEAVSLYPGYKRINALKNLKQDILSPVLNVNASQSVYPGEEVKMQVNHKNLDGFKLQLLQGKKLLSEQHYSLCRPDDYTVKDTTFSFKAPADGKYVMRIIPDIRAKKDSESELAVSRIKVLTCRLPNNQYEIVTLDGMTGQPIADAVITLYKNDEKTSLMEVRTDASGKAILAWNDEYRYLKATKGQDTALPLQNIYGGSYGYYSDSNKSDDLVRLLTDRSLYRPGQTVHVKGIAFAQQPDTAHVLANKSYTLILTDANNQEVGKKEVRTNDFGSFTADFILPSACLNGNFSLRTGTIGQTTIRVEDYKRPTFDITFDKQEGSYQLGDKVLVKGKAQTYSGVLMEGMPAKYVVKRTVFRFWPMETSILASGEVTTNENGEFSIPVVLEEEAGYKDDASVFYRYQVEVSITNVAGETQASTDILVAGKRSLVLSVDLKENICKDEPIKTVFKATNLNMQPVAVKGTYQLYAYTDIEKNQVGGTSVYSGTFTSNEEMLLDAWKSVPSGAYQLVVSAKDDQGRDVTYKQRIVLFSLKDTRPPVLVPIWYYETNTKFDAVHPAVFYFGTSKKNTYVLMDGFSDGKQIENKTMQLSDSIIRFEYPYKEEYGNGISVTFCFVKEGVMYQQTVKMEKRLPDKTLSMKWDVFRDKLRPGQEEEWKLTIKTPQGTPAVAEMLATMYDASLDKIWKQTQSLTLFYNLWVPSVNWMNAMRGNNFFNYWWPDKKLKVPAMAYDHFVMPPEEDIIYAVYDPPVMATRIAPKSLLAVRAAGAQLSGSANMKSAAKEDSGVALGEEMVAFDSATELNAEETLPEESASLRTNFAETAFFYPQLLTNEQGEVSFSFTMPQSLTRWNFRGYAHTKGMLTGTLDSETTTSKEFMLTPNLPRFVRVGDKTSVAASIANLTGKDLTGTVSFILFDPMTEKVISTQKQKFSVDAGKTVGTSFMFTVSDKYEVLGCRMIADGGTFSDGEQHLLPVLSNKENLVETVPMPIRGKETRTFSLDSLFNHHSKTATDRKLTVEFTGNPAWYAIQALPSLSLPTNDNAISWASAYYANTLASYIMNSQPRIKAVFDSWKLQGGTKETFLSNLQKNQEVKNIILQESPWVMEAQTEAEQKERIATLFDLNSIRNNNITALTKLKELQLPDGSWTWYKGMNGSRYITDFVVELNARLTMLTKQPLEGNAAAMQKSAFDYLNMQALDEYKNILKAEKEGNKTAGISNAALKYLYLIAISGEKVPSANEAAYGYFLSKVGSLLQSGSMDNKALAAIILQKAGKAKAAGEFIASLKEHLVNTDEGMYFAFNESPYIWTGMRIPVHVEVMEAFESVSGNSSVVEEMKLWLLKQKQTQQWNSPVATADAVYALLMQGTDFLASQGDVRITIANQVIETQSQAKTTVAGLGYVKETFTSKKVIDASKVTVEKRDAGIAWGAVYAQYQEEISEVKQQGGELNVKKQLYVERLVNNVNQLQPVTEKTVLSIGDKVVSRLTIRLDRAMDFVQLKDQRGACFEPIGELSGYRWNKGMGYYIAVNDASTNFFFDSLSKGVYVLEYSYRVSRAGTYETGLATIQSAYAPEFASHSASEKVTVSSSPK